MAGRRWGPDAPADADAARTRLVDAAEACIDRFGVAKTTVDDVATEASVSRATVYRYFAHRDELVLAVILRALQRSYEPSWLDFSPEARDAAAMGEAIVDAAVHLLVVVRANPTLHVLVQHEGSATVTGASRAFFRALSDDLVPRLQPAQAAGLIRSDLDLAETCEWLLRCCLSLLTVEGPHPRSLDDERRLLATFVLPALLPAP